MTPKSSRQAIVAYNHLRDKRRSRRPGFSLAEAGLVLGLAMLAAVLAFAAYTIGSNSIATRSQVSAAAELINNIKRMYSINNAYTGVSPSVVSNAGLIPAGFRTTGTVINHNWGGTVLIAPSGTGDLKFQVTFSQIPKRACVDFAMGIAGLADEIRVAATSSGAALKTINTDLNVTSLATACSNNTDANRNVIVLVS